ncbi:tyrosine-type recombinase/integrase [Cupriavidus sp. 8B]
MRIIKAQPKREARIFPANSDAVSAAFTRAAKFLEIDDLHLRDMRHEGASRLFEMGLSIPRVAAVTGHRSWQSQKRYTHLRHEGDRFARWKWLDVAAPPKNSPLDQDLGGACVPIAARFQVCDSCRHGFEYHRPPQEFALQNIDLLSQVAVRLKAELCSHHIPALYIHTVNSTTHTSLRTNPILYIHTVITGPTMKPEPADCPICHAAAERTRQRGGRGFKYSCPTCGTYEVTSALLGCGARPPASAREELARLRAYGYKPRVEFHARDGIRIGPSRSGGA